jgi:hypothetical protein
MTSWRMGWGAWRRSWPAVWIRPSWIGIHRLLLRLRRLMRGETLVRSRVHLVCNEARRGHNHARLVRNRARSVHSWIRRLYNQTRRLLTVTLHSRRLTPDLGQELRSSLETTPDLSLELKLDPDLELAAEELLGLLFSVSSSAPKPGSELEPKPKLQLSKRAKAEVAKPTVTKPKAKPRPSPKSPSSKAAKSTSALLRCRPSPLSPRFLKRRRVSEDEGWEDKGVGLFRFPLFLYCSLRGIDPGCQH